MLLINTHKRDFIMNTKQAIERLLSNITKDSETLASIKQAVESGNQSFDEEFVTVWGERVESCKRAIKALDDKSGYVKSFYNRAYLVVNAADDAFICVIE